MCEREDRPRSAELLVWVGAASIAVAVGLLAWAHDRVPLELLLAMAGIATAVTGVLMISDAAVISRLHRIEAGTRHTCDQLDGQLVEDPETVTRMRRRV